MKLLLAQYWAGRILLHILCIVLDHHLIWHISGIVREVYHKTKA